jgi:hypothetical protein
MLIAYLLAWSSPFVMILSVLGAVILTDRDSGPKEYAPWAAGLILGAMMAGTASWMFS